MAIACALLADDCPPAPARLGPYQVLGSLAEGGMGIVLRGRDLRDGGVVALKLARSPTSEDAASIRREIAALAQLSHPGIVRLLAHGCANGVPWMAMELLAGRTVSEVIETLWHKPSPRVVGLRRVPRHSDDLPTTRERRPVERRVQPVLPGPRPPAAAGRLRDVIDILAQLCRALDHVHGHGLVHRDVKPANVILGDDGRATLLDFGLVCGMPGQIYADVQAESGAICVGTMEYAAPEQIRGEPVDARADIYSLGCLLYELVTGRRTVDTGSSGKLVDQRPPREPSALVSSLAPPLEGLLLAMMAKRREDRPSSAGQVADALARIDRL